jgi:CheY-like chemotaxis protein
MADSGQVHQVVLNMAINARDAMPAGGDLKFCLSNATVSVAEALRIPDGVPGEYVLLTVSDTGMGMSRETMGRIFEPFFTTKDPSKGTGLGLATCHGIIKQTNGMVTVASTPGAGTTFSIYLPKAQEGAEVDAVRPSDQGDSPRGTETILLVEDEDILRELGMEVLTSLGYEVITAPDGAAAVEILMSEARQRIDMVATDLVMPRMNGRELNAWINKNAWGMRVLFMSGYTDDEIVRTAVQGAEVQFLQKPFTPDALARKIRQVLDGRKTKQAA